VVGGACEHVRDVHGVISSMIDDRGIAHAFWLRAPGCGEIRPVRLPERGRDDVVVRTVRSGVSRGTETLVFRGGVPPDQYARMRAPFQEGDFPGPVKYGYLNVGAVEQGPPELRGRTVFCLYPHQTAYVVPAGAVTIVPEGVPPARAVLAGTVETAVNALWDAGPLLGDRVAVVGGGMVGYNAAVIALGMGAQVTVLERSVDRMRFLEQILSGRVQLLMSSALQLEESIKVADLTIGAVLIPGALAPKLITREMLGTMKESSVFVDVAIDQGGCAETSKPTTHDDPVYTVDGVIHYCVANMPGAVPITSTRALTNVTLPYVEQLADLGTIGAVTANSELARGVNTIAGRLTYEAVADAHGMDYTPLDDALAAGVA